MRIKVGKKKKRKESLGKEMEGEKGGLSLVKDVTSNGAAPHQGELCRDSGIVLDCVVPSHTCNVFCLCTYLCL